ncbi:MAG: hypothetical protein GY782_04390 [Gammaproteobacteria bacterium]|nr:hypothetical protein [Gammaproteobacteria bacterium]
MPAASVRVADGSTEYCIRYHHCGRRAKALHTVADAGDGTAEWCAVQDIHAAGVPNGMTHAVS